MPFSADAWALTAVLQEAIRTHPFNEALAAGTLDRERFEFYLVQDSRYLGGFARALAVVSARAARVEDAAFLASSAHDALTVERLLHTAWLDGEGTQVDLVPTAPSALAYVSWLQAAAHHEPWEVAVAALLPCFWIYERVGTDIHHRTQGITDHPYRAWIDTYADEDYAATVTAMRRLVDTAAGPASAEVEAQMTGAFVRASEFEWMFWDAAWRQQGWPTAEWL